MPLKTNIKSTDTLVICCPSFRGKMALPEEEFFESVGLQDASRIMLFDEKRLKFLTGLPPEFETFQSILDYLRDLIEEHGFKKIITTGTSVGAHSALLLGHLLKADHTVAYAPYPYCSEKLMIERADPSSESFIRVLKPLNALPDELKQYLDLGDVLKEWNGKTEYEVHASRHYVWDYKRAQYLRGLPHLRIITHAYDRHALMDMLKRRGELANCFKFPFRRSHPLKELFYRVIYFIKPDRDNFRKFRRAAKRAKDD